MRWTSCLVVAALALFGCGPSTPEMQIVSDAAEAIGGMRAVQDAKTLVLEARGENFRLGQNRTPDSDLPTYQISELTREIDYENGRWRLEQARTSNFLTGSPVLNQRQIMAVDGDVAFNVSADGAARRASRQVALDRRAELYHYPVGIIQAAMAEGATLSNARQEGGHDVVDLTTAQGDHFTLFVDSETKLPAKVVSTSYNTNLGDVAIETEFTNYQEVGGLGGFGARLTLPRQIQSRIDQYPLTDIVVSASAVNAEIGDLAAPGEVTSAEELVARANVTVEEVTQGVWLLAGQSHNSVLVEFADQLTLIEAPNNDTRTLAVIERARELQPEKPLQYVINTHHHFDHSGGIRAAVSEGLTVITHELNRPFFENIVARSHTMTPDALANNPMPLAIDTVAANDKYVLDDGRRSLEVYPIVNDEHSGTIVMVYLPRERLLIEADVFSPGRAAQPFLANLLENIDRLGLRVDRVVPIHGGVTPFKELQAAAMEASPSQ